MASAAEDLHDPTIYPVTDEMGEGSLQRFISELLRALIVSHLTSEGRRAFVGANQFIYYEQHNSKACVAPDVYVLDGVDPDIEIIDDPALMAKGGDPQLDAGIELMLRELSERPFRPVPVPSYPDRSGMGIREEDK